MVSVVSAASFSEVAISPGSLASVRGQEMTRSSASALTNELPTTLAGVQVRLRRRGGSAWTTARLLLASPEVINFVVPDRISPGLYLVRVVRENRRDLEAYAPVETLAPAVFFGEVEGDKYAAATLLRVRPDGSYATEPLLDIDPESNGYRPVPVRFHDPAERLYLSLYGTGIGNRKISVFIDSDRVPVQYSGPQGGLPGLDQINVELTPALASEAEVTITVSGETEDGASLESVPVRLMVASHEPSAAAG